MAKRKKYTPFNAWETTQEDGHEKRYIRMGVTQMMHPAIYQLSHSAYRVYAYMKLESGGKRDFTFAKSKWKKMISPGGFQSAKRELMDAGFIELVENNAHRRKPNVYRFSTTWKELK